MKLYICDVGEQTDYMWSGFASLCLCGWPWDLKMYMMQTGGLLARSNRFASKKDGAGFLLSSFVEITSLFIEIEKRHTFGPSRYGNPSCLSHIISSHKKQEHQRHETRKLHIPAPISNHTEQSRSPITTKLYKSGNLQTEKETRIKSYNQLEEEKIPLFYSTPKSLSVSRTTPKKRLRQKHRTPFYLSCFYPGIVAASMRTPGIRMTCLPYLPII